MKQKEFKVGDRVKIRGYSNQGGLFDGDHGTVLKTHYGERFQERIIHVGMGYETHVFTASQLIKLKKKSNEELKQARELCEKLDSLNKMNLVKMWMHFESYKEMFQGVVDGTVHLMPKLLDLVEKQQKAFQILHKLICMTCRCRTPEKQCEYCDGLQKAEEVLK